ncbi:lytic murein transglycosylase [Roseicella aquatilis]|uniref:Lytic murein transglycosylase n=1 Tax=Roseicella aquatilis TaxID=2527868 RepID=A0A4R4DUK5_9PROT|nr:lytic murein transglycosylase [Roseicella aquatilis]TCZ66792.1 lytic murein transglycosylase [Roseicella aquatilis]
MLHRRLVLGGAFGLAACSSQQPAVSQSQAAPVAAVVPAAAPETLAPPPVSFDRFLAGVRADAQRGGISPAILQRALANIRPNDRVIALDRKQPEGALSWVEYRDRIMLSPTRIANGQKQFAENRRLLASIESRFRVAPAVIVAIWGVETNFGGNTGGFNAVEALATLAWEGRRASYFRKELMAALGILNEGNIPPERMTSSWAGALGQPQFMPTNFDRLAVDFDGDGRRDIWNSRADALASIAHYFQKNGWREGEPWGREVLPPAGVDPTGVDTDSKRPLADFARLGFRNADGSPLPRASIESQLVLPNRGSGQLYIGHHNLRVIRRYNPPVNYGLAVGLLSDNFG